MTLSPALVTTQMNEEDEKVEEEEQEMVVAQPMASLIEEDTNMASLMSGRGSNLNLK